MFIKLKDDEYINLKADDVRKVHLEKDFINTDTCHVVIDTNIVNKTKIRDIGGDKEIRKEYVKYYSNSMTEKEAQREIVEIVRKLRLEGSE